MGRDLSDEEYKYCREPSKGRPLVELINIFAEFTPLSAGIESMDPANRDACQELLVACVAQKNSFLQWYALRKEAIGGDPLESSDDFCCIDIHPVNTTFGRAYSFVFLDNALLHVLYWTAMAIVSAMVSRVQTLVKSHENEAGPVGDHTADEEYLKMQAYADQIVRSVPFFVQEKNKLLGPHMVMFGVAAACKAYINLGIFEKFDWCQKTLGSFADRGFEACQHYREYAWNYWNATTSSAADSFLPISVRGKRMGDSPIVSNNQVTDTSEYGQYPFPSPASWKYSDRCVAFSPETILLEDPWQKGTMCCVAT
jgi:hypothetical protein